jgi:anti-sigma B factor antagonist
VPDIRFPVNVAGDIPVVGAPEEIDVTNSDGLKAAMLEAAQLHQVMVIDMGQTRFCDSAGLHALLSARKHARDQGGELMLVLTGAAVLRVLAITGADRLIPSFATMSEALAYAADVIATASQ